MNKGPGGTAQKTGGESENVLAIVQSLSRV